MAISREIMSIMAGVEALASPRTEAARPLPGKTATARVEAILRWISGAILARRFVLTARDVPPLALDARSGRLVGCDQHPGAGLAALAGVIVALARAEGPHRIEVELPSDQQGNDGVGHATADLRAACAAALDEAEAGTAAPDFDAQLAGLAVAAARLQGDALLAVSGDAARLPQGDALARLGADLQAVAAELSHLGGVPAIVVIGAPDDPAGQLALTCGAEPWVAALPPAALPRLVRHWVADQRARQGTN